MAQIEEVRSTTCGLVSSGSDTPSRVRWVPPPPGWVKINSDGASRGNPSPSGCGGLIRDERGKWLRGFYHYFGLCDAYTAEL